MTSVALLLFDHFTLLPFSLYAVLHIDGVKSSSILPHKTVCHNYNALFSNSHGAYSEM